MDSWLRGRDAIFNSLAEVCDRIEVDLKAELHRERNLECQCSVHGEELEVLKNRAANAERLERENQELRTRIEQLAVDQHPLEAVQTSETPLVSTEQLLRSRGPLTPVSHNQATPSPRPNTTELGTDDVDWKRQAAINGAKYIRINTELRKAKEALLRFRQERDDWKICAKKWEKKFKNIETQHEVPTSSSTAEKHSGRSPSAPRPSFGHLASDVPVLAKRDDKQPLPGQDGDATPTSGEGSHELEKMAERDGTGREDAPDVQLPELPRGEGFTAPVPIKQEPSSDDTPIVVSERALRKRKHDETDIQEQVPRQIKREETGSDPAVTAEFCDFNPAESVDLDMVNTRVDTPRKRRQLEAVRQDTFLRVEESSMPNLPREPRQMAQTPTPLQARDPNIQSLKASGKPPKRGLSRAVGSLAEDGADYHSVSSSRSTSHRHGISASNGKLSSLLSRPEIEPETPVIRSARRTTMRADLVVDDPMDFAPQPRELPFDKSTGERTRQLAHDPTEPSPRPRQERAGAGPPLRSKPRSALRLDDFKINPKFNNGYQFAYNEVVRSRDERGRLPGCVDPDCCGRDFRAMALAERGVGPRTTEQHAEDRKLLEDYLGAASFRLFSMTKEEKDELWIEAKTRQIADRCGRHRHRFSRMKSPPGFWRTDFPSTQEIEEDKAEAMRREKEMIQEKYREAMRPDGKWKFRDE